MNPLYWSDIVEGRRRGPAAACVRAALIPPSLAYRLAVSARNAAYGRGILRVARLRRPVVSVGNLVVGGTGKTPLVKLLARGLRERALAGLALVQRELGATVMTENLGDMGAQSIRAKYASESGLDETIPSVHVNSLV